MRRPARLIASPLVALLAGVAPGAHPAGAQTAADSAAIRAAALDYIDGWYTGDGARMERALHPELAKRMVATDSAAPAGRRSFLDQQSALTLVQGTRAGGGRDTPPARRRQDVTVLDVYRGAASAKVVAAGWVDYLHLAKWNGRWVIVNVLWELTPEALPRAGSR